MCGIKEIEPYANELVSHCGEKFGFDEPPKLFYKEDEQNALNPLGKTAHYDPTKKAITVFVSGRHVKDVLRSIAHELVHHVQNLRGDLSPEKCGEMSATYAQDNPHMRNMEKEAYLVGNITFRDWENGVNSNININLKENKIMVKTTENKIKALIKKIIAEKMGYKRDDKDLKETENQSDETLEENEEETLEEWQTWREKEGKYDPNAPDREKVKAPGTHSSNSLSMGADVDVDSSAHQRCKSAATNLARLRGKTAADPMWREKYDECMAAKERGVYETNNEAGTLEENEEATTVSDGGLNHYSKHSGYNVVTQSKRAQFMKLDSQREIIGFSKNCLISGRNNKD